MSGTLKKSKSGETFVAPTMYLIIPCYNEGKALPITVPLFVKKLRELRKNEKISEKSRILLIDDGSRDNTREVILTMRSRYPEVKALFLKSNKGQQRALYKGMRLVRDMCDIAITMDADGQNELSAIDRMLSEHKRGSDIVMGVRDTFAGDGFIKRITASIYYHVLRLTGASVVKNHADFRLVNRKAMKEMEKFEHPEMFLRGCFSMMDLKKSIIRYKCGERLAGRSVFSFRKMLRLGINGIIFFSSQNKL